MTRAAENPLIVACPRCGAPVGVQCTALGTLSGKEPPYGEFPGVHSPRRNLAKKTQPALTKAPELPTGCQCRNHLGAAKSPYRTREQAVAWAARSRRVRGMRMEPYRCPTSSKWHVRTARKEVSA